MATASSLSFFRGRLGKSDYWKLAGGIMAIRVAAIVAVVARPDWERHLGVLDFLIIFLGGLVGCRLRDFGWSPAWGWVSVAVLAFVLPLVVLFTGPSIHPGTSAMNAFPAWFGASSFALLMTLLIVVGRQPGDPAPNRYGAPPEPIFKRGV